MRIGASLTAHLSLLTVLSTTSGMRGKLPSHANITPKLPSIIDSGHITQKVKSTPIRPPWKSLESIKYRSRCRGNNACTLECLICSLHQITHCALGEINTTSTDVVPFPTTLSTSSLRGLYETLCGREVTRSLAFHSQSAA